MRVAVYCRVSTGKEIQKDSLITQKQMANQLISSKGWSLHDYYEDTARGTRPKRPELQRMLKDAKEKKFDIIITKELSRLARNGQLSYEIRNLTQNKGIHIITFDNLIDTTKGQEFAYGLYTAVYEQESKSISTRVKSVFKIKAQNGEYLASRPPLGYKVVDKKLIIRNDETPDLIRRIFREYIEGKGHDAIANSLTKDNIKTPSAYAKKITTSSSIWHGSSVRVILENPHYTGDLVQNRSSTINLFDDARVIHDESELIIVKNTHQPIISREEYQLTQKLIEQRMRIRPQPQRNLFSNLLFCADCGRAMHHKKNGSLNSSAYVCGNFNKSQNKTCTSHRVKVIELSFLITDELKRLFVSLNNEQVMKLLKQKISSKEKDTNKQLPLLEKEIKEKKEFKSKLFKRYVEDVSIEAMYKETDKQIDIEIQQAEEKIKSIKHGMLTDKELKVFEILKVKLEKTLSFEELTSDMLNTVIEKIEIKADGSPRIHYRFSNTSALYLLNSSHAQHST